MKNTQRGFAIGIVVAVIAILALGGGAVYVASHAKKTVQVENDTTQATTTAEVSANAVAGGMMSIKGLLGLGKSLTCTFSDATSTAKTTGTVYIASGKVRGNFTSNVTNVGEVKSYMISDGQEVYIWSDMMKQGFKMKVAASQQTKPNPDAVAPDINKELNYSCNPWTADASVFVPPASVTFMDMASVGAGAGANIKVPAGVNGSANVDINAMMNR